VLENETCKVYGGGDSVYINQPIGQGNCLMEQE
jgi:hypothetical protein